MPNVGFCREYGKDTAGSTTAKGLPEMLLTKENFLEICDEMFKVCSACIVCVCVCVCVCVRARMCVNTRIKMR